MVKHLFDSSSGLFADGINLTHHAVHSSILAAASEAPAPRPITVSCLFRLINWLAKQWASVFSSEPLCDEQVVREPTMAVAVLAALKRRGLFDGRVLTTCWIAGPPLRLSMPWVESARTAWPHI
eukprot:COSAG03_NODE_898_length_5429_cov_1.947467_6_plen_124_part_00